MKEIHLGIQQSVRDGVWQTRRAVCFRSMSFSKVRPWQGPWPLQKGTKVIEWTDISPRMGTFGRCLFHLVYNITPFCLAFFSVYRKENKGRSGPVRKTGLLKGAAGFV